MQWLSRIGTLHDLNSKSLFIHSTRTDYIHPPVEHSFTSTSSHIECIRNRKWHWLETRDALVAIYSSKRDASSPGNVPSIHYRSPGIPSLFDDVDAVQQSQCQCQMQCAVLRRRCRSQWSNEATTQLAEEDPHNLNAPCCVRSQRMKWTDGCSFVARIQPINAGLSVYLKVRSPSHPHFTVEAGRKST